MGDGVRVFFDRVILAYIQVNMVKFLFQAFRDLVRIMLDLGLHGTQA